MTRGAHPGERYVADLVEEERVPVRAREEPPVIRDRAGEGALLVTEELALEERLGDGAAVDGDEGLVRARAGPVDGPGDEFLARPALALDQDACVAGGHALRLGEHVLHERGTRHDLLPPGLPGAPSALAAAVRAGSPLDLGEELVGVVGLGG
jgi:hypothetical protein